MCMSACVQTCVHDVGGGWCLAMMPTFFSHFFTVSGDCLSSNGLYITCKNMGRKGTINDKNSHRGSDNTNALTKLVASQRRGGKV